MGFYTQVGYRSAKIADREGRAPTGGTGWRHERVDRERLIKQSREFRRNNELYTALIRRMRRYVVGKGFKLQCSAPGEDGKKLNESVEEGWRAFWDEGRPDVTGRLTGARCLRLVFEELFTAGDNGVALVKRGGQNKIQIFEAEQIKGPKGSGDDGIEKDEFDQPTKFWVCPYGAGGEPDISKGKSYTPDTFLYLSAELERPTSSRAVPPAQASFPMLHRLVDIFNSEAIARQVQARIALAITRASGPPIPGKKASNVEQDDTEDGDQDPVSKYQTQLPYATFFHGGPGDKVEGMQRSAPGVEFANTLAAFLRIFCACVGMPLEFFTFDFTRLNYSQFRGAVEVFQAECEDWQALLEGFFLEPIFAWWLASEIAAGRQLKAAQGIKHSWIKGRFPWTDKLKESQAAGEQADRGQRPYGSILKEQGFDPEHVRAALDQETRTAIEMAQAIKKDTGVDPGWWRFAGLKAPTAPAIPGAAPPASPADDAPPADGSKKDSANDGKDASDGDGEETE